MDQTPFDITNHSDLSSFSEEPESSLGTLEIASLLVRTVTVVLTLLGGILLVAKNHKGNSDQSAKTRNMSKTW